MIKNSILKETYNTRFISLKHKESLLIRSDKIDDCSEETISFLHKLGIRTIIDFRNLSDKTLNKYLSAYGIELINCEMSFRQDREEFLKENGREGNEYEYYVFLLKKTNRIKSVFEAILKSSNGVLINCSAGRDRSGVVSMLIEMIVGFDKDFIIEDMAISDINLFKRDKEYEIIGSYLNYEKAKTRANEVYNWIIENYGSIKNYIAAVFNNKNIYRDIKKRLLELVK